MVEDLVSHRGTTASEPRGSGQATEQCLGLGFPICKAGGLAHAQPLYVAAMRTPLRQKIQQPS